jgi:hypothetical protein
MAERHRATLEKLSPEEKRELDTYAEKILADIAEGVSE